MQQEVMGTLQVPELASPFWTRIFGVLLTMDASRLSR